MSELSSQKEGGLKPVKRKSRHRCPFYGFYLACKCKLFIDQGGNQCSLIAGSYSPCQMEIRGKTLDWDKCSFFNHKENEMGVQEIIQRTRIAPKEFWPAGQSSWQGLSFEEWMKYVMGDEVKRPPMEKTQ